MFLFTPVPVKTEEDAEELQPSQLHQRPSKQMGAGADGEPEDCGRAEPAPERHLRPETEVKSEDSSGAETDDSDDWWEIREHQTSLDSQGRGGISHGASTFDFDSKRIICPESDDFENNHMKVVRNNHNNVFSDPRYKNQVLDREHLSQHMMVNNGAHRGPKQEDSVSPLIKEEHEEVWISQDRTNNLTFTSAPVKSEDDEEKPQPSQLHDIQDEQMETRADGGVCGRAEPARTSDPETLLQPETEDMIEDSYGSDDSSDSDSREQRPGFTSTEKRRNSNGCSECGKRFLGNHNLIHPMRVHTGEKPFSCSFCSKRFPQEGNPQTKRHKCVDGQASDLHQKQNEETKEAEPGADVEDHGGVELDSDSDPKRHLQPETEVRTKDPYGTDDSGDSDFWTETRQRRPNEDKAKKVLKAERRTYDCSECGKRFLWHQNLTQHMRRHTGEKPFSCSICSKRFAQKGNLTRHLVVHVKEKPFSCIECGKKFKEMSYMKRHMATHRGEKPLCCKVCAQRFSWYNQLKRHKCFEGQASDLHQKQNEETTEAEPGADGRDHGGVELDSDSDPKRHLQPETEDMIEDSSGSDDNTESDSLTETRECRPGFTSMKKKRKSHGCTECGKRFFGNHNLIHHMRVHTGEKPFSCSFCSKRFAQKGNLTRHLMVHVKEKPFSCFDCGKKFKEISYMKRHMAIHKGEKPLRCRVCAQRFSWYYQLKRHKCVEGQASDLTEPGADEEEHKRIKLDSTSDLKRHLQPETEVRIKDPHETDDSGDSDFWTETRQRRPNKEKANEGLKAAKRTYDCSECGKRFKLKRLLTQHMRRHTGEKPFSCSICNKSFKHKPYLNLHMAHHRGEKPFSCSGCDLSFTWNYQLQRHQCETGQLLEPHLNQTEKKPEAGGSEQARKSDPERCLQPDTKVKTEDFSGAETEDSDDDLEGGQRTSDGFKLN